MIKQRKISKFKKTVAIYLAMMILLETFQPMQIYALTSGPSQPEFNAFTPVGTSDMVNLSTGDFNYNIPIMDVGGYPLNLAYNSGSGMDQESSWVGLGWNLNVGEISRQVRGLPDDFRGDKIKYENNVRDVVTVGTNFNISPAFFGKDIPISLGLGVQYNNYEGVTFKPSIGISYSVFENTKVGFNLTGSTGDGASISPTVSISSKLDRELSSSTLNTGIGVSLNSRKGLENLSVFSSSSNTHYITDNAKYMSYTKESEGSVGASISFNNTNNYTPTKRVAYDNISGIFNASLGSEVFGAEVQGRVTAYGSVQKINSKYKSRLVAAYGYENGQYKNDSEGVLDFNREKEQLSVSKNTTVLPVTNYTFDIYNIEGQGVSGMFRPFKSQITYVYNDKVSDFGSSTALGGEIGGGNLLHAGINFNETISTTTTGKWSRKNNTVNAFTERSTDKNDLLYEPVYFKLVGELDVDSESNETYKKEQLSGSNALRLKIDGGSFDRKLMPTYLVKPTIGLDNTYKSIDIKAPIKRQQRLIRNQEIQKITNEQADDKFVYKNVNAQNYHTVGMKTLQPDGTTYIYGKAVYNNEKIEATFDVSGQPGNNHDGKVTYNKSLEKNGNKNSDEYVNKTTTPSYAHTYLITSVLSSDYQDLDDNGPSDKDLGAYTKFDYTKPGDIHYVSNYQWKVPYEKNKASYNEGLKTSKKDQRGNYIYGKKDLTYLKKIETKTYVAFIDLEKRKDAIGVDSEEGGMGSEAMSYIKSIRLYSKSELLAAKIDLETVANTATGLSVKPIKTAHFEYDYSLCPNIPSNNGVQDRNNSLENAGKGKLTLKRLYFTYRGSNMGKYTPYKFDYSKNNPNYDIKAVDIWGNSRSNDPLAALTPAEFPFVEQDKVQADKNTSAWQLETVTLPSGGKLTIHTESDDYKYVQNKKAMQMFKVVGAGDTSIPTLNNKLYNSKIHNKYIYVNVTDETLTNSEFKQKYLSENINKPIYFKFLLNMTSKSSDFVTGYFEIDKDEEKINPMVVRNHMVAIPMRYLELDGMMGDKDRKVNPIAKAGWGFGRTYLNRAVYSLSEEEVDKNFKSIVYDLVGSLKSMTEVFKSPNAVLETNGCAKTFTPGSSWIRLENPNGKKLGGGLRVSKIELSDQWDVMNNVTGNIYNEKYGQQYSYVLEDGITSSGVAAFEPNASAENPFVEPFYGTDSNYADRIAAPKEQNYVEKPFGESFFPSPKVTYSRVVVSNIDKHENGDKIVKKHATGKVITEHYTTKDFPTLVDYTDLDIRPDLSANPILQVLNVYSVNHLTASQGFSIETNDMDGKVKSESVYGEGQNKPISKVEYKYNIGKDGKLDNKLITINSKGEISPQIVGVNYDVINDFTESYSTAQTFGADGNFAAFLVTFFPGFVPTIFPRVAYHESILRTSTTTKVVHKTGVLIEKIAYDLGSKVSTKNLAWDSKTGQILLTQTLNEFDDNYYNFSYPAYWNYENMGLASENLSVAGELINDAAYFTIKGFTVKDISKYFKIGDELIVGKIKFWVTGYSTDKSKIQLMDRDGNVVNASNMPSDLNFIITRSGNKNMQMATMASVTSMTNPIENVSKKITDDTFGYSANTTFNKKVINASAVEYSDDWKSQCENGLPNAAGLSNGIKTNPYLYNTKGNWRAIKSYAYLTGRNNSGNTNRRNTGYFTSFNPFYKFGGDSWSKDSANWTFASEVTKYSPYGVELENKDALERYSSAQYGYNYTLPIAVASNAKYGEIGFDGFEDYGIPNPELDALRKSHFGFAEVLSSNVAISDSVSHTGNNSIVVHPGQKASFVRKINGCKAATPTTPIPCEANVIATPSSQTIISGQTTSIVLAPSIQGKSYIYSWTVQQNGVSGASAGTGSSIVQTLTNTGAIAGTVTFTITPKSATCSGTPISVTITVNKQVEQNPTETFYVQGQWTCDDTLHEPEINSWVDYIDENNIQQHAIVGCAGISGEPCLVILAQRIVTYNNSHSCQ